jgi:quercetin dioxygenase-like cupin family protein/alkylhydroperoxidase/carboxymuconolactone decarboxylase family protein YurZ
VENGFSFVFKAHDTIANTLKINHFDMFKCLKFTLIILISMNSFYVLAQNTIFPQGEKATNENFAGNVWVNALLAADSSFNSSIGNVVFEPKSRTKWHKHPAGQILIALDGIGYYQEKGKPLQILRKGDIAKCPPDVEHWHGASHNSPFVQLAITTEHPKGRVIWLHSVTEQEYNQGLTQGLESQKKITVLEKRHQHIIKIASCTAKGNLEQLKKELEDGLNEGLTINEAKEILVHLYAYCGFPRSIQGLNTLISVLETRKTQGMTDKIGNEASPIKNESDKYERGKKVLEKLTGQPQTKPKTGYGAFSPEIDVFLKEHLFADIFERDVLSYTDREYATIAVLTTLGGVEPMLQGHINIGMNLGMTATQLSELMTLIEYLTGKTEAEVGRKVLKSVVESRK